MSEEATPVTADLVEGTPEAIAAQNLAALSEEDAPKVVPATPATPPVPPVVPLVTTPATPHATPPADPPAIPPAPVKSGDPFLDGYNATPPEKRAEYVANYNQAAQILTMDADTGLKHVYQQAKNDAGERLYTDEETDQYVSGLSKIQKDREWNQMKGAIEHQQAQALQVPEPTQAEIDTYIATENARVTAMITPILLAEDAMTDIYGMPYTPEMKAQFKEDFTKLNMINPKTGDTYLYEYLKENNNLTEMIRSISLNKGTNNLKVFLSNFKEDFKADTFDKLGVSLKLQGGSGQFAVAQTEDDLL